MVSVLQSAQRRKSVIAACTAVLLFLGSLWLRLEYKDATVPITPLRSDAALYTTYAVNLLQSGIYSGRLEPDPAPERRVTPGYPLFLAAVIALTGTSDLITVRPEGIEGLKEAYEAVLKVQCVLGALVVVMAFWTAYRCLAFPSAIAVGLLTGLSPHLVTAGCNLLTETLFSFLVVGSVLLLSFAVQYRSPRFSLLSSVVAGLAALVRPVALLVPPVWAVVTVLVWRPKDRWRMATALMIGVVLVWLPWAVRNRVGQMPGSRAGLSSFVFGSYPDLIHESEKKRGYPYQEDAEYDEMMSSVGSALSILRSRVVAEPAEYLRWYAVGKVRMYWQWKLVAAADEIHLYPVAVSLYHTNLAANLTLRLMRFLHPWLVGLMAVGMILILPWLKMPPAGTQGLIVVLVFATLVYFTAVHEVLAPIPRYAVPIRPLLYIAAVFSAERLVVLISPLLASKIRLLRDEPHQ